MPRPASDEHSGQRTDSATVFGKTVNSLSLSCCARVAISLSSCASLGRTKLHSGSIDCRLPDHTIAVTEQIAMSQRIAAIRRIRARRIIVMTGTIETPV